MATPNEKINPEEQEILDSFEAGEWQSVENREAEISRHRQYASSSLKKEKRINIRITLATLEAIQTKALEEGIPYQILIARILHKYINNRFIECEHN